MNIEVAKAGKCLKDNKIEDLAFSTEFITPKIVKIFNIQTDGTTPKATSHGISYAPLCIKYLRDWMSDGTAKYLPYNYQSGIGNGLDDSSFYGYFSAMWNPNTEDYEQPVLRVVVFSDSIESNDDDTPSAGSPKIVVYNGEENVNPREKVNGRCDMLKADKTGLLELDLPAKNIAAFGSDTNTVTYTHNKGYLPIVAPFDAYFSWFSLSDYYCDEVTQPIPAEVILNNISGNRVERLYPIFPEDYIHEAVTFYFTDEKLYLTHDRYNVAGIQAQAPARNIKLYYTIFENRLDENLNLLS
jgi:hypothetical protein